MESNLTGTALPNVQSVNARPTLSGTGLSRLLIEPYRDRVKRARAAAATGLGWEDIMVEFRIGAELARQMVGLRGNR
jgi:hypothetical protein